MSRFFSSHGPHNFRFQRIALFVFPVVMLAVGLLTACLPPSHLRNRELEDPRELRARAELQKVENAQNLGSSVPRWRYEKIIERYPQTVAAYECTLVLSRIDFTTLNTLRQTSASKANQAAGFTDFIEEYGFGAHSMPQDPRLAEDFRREIHPRLYDALSWLGNRPLQFRYIERFPNMEGSAKLRQSIEAEIVQPNLRWDAVKLLNAYAVVQPRSPNIEALRDRIQVNILAYIDEFGTKKDCDLFFEYFPESPYRARVETLKSIKTI